MCTATDAAHEASMGRFAGNGDTRERVVRAGMRVMSCTLVPVNEPGVSHYPAGCNRANTRSFTGVWQ